MIYFSIGKRTVNVVPSLTTVTKLIVPLNDSMMFFAIASPKPIPSDFEEKLG
jgi:hypothetical protein